MKRTALCAALAAAFAPAWAQEPDPEVTALTKPESEVSVGLGYWNKDRPRLGTYDGMSQMGAYGLLDAYIRSRDDRLGTWFTLDARNLGLETRELRADWLRQGNYGTFLEYNRAVRDEPYTVYTAARGIGTTTIRVPTPSAPVTALNEYHLGTVREAFGGGFNKFFGNNFEFRITGRTEDKSGERLWGRGGAPEFAAEPINSNISQIEAVLAYTGKTFQVQGGYYGSWYKNKNDLVDTANINAAGVISNQYFLSLPLDNEAHQFYVNGGYDFSARTRATFKAAYTRATQDEQIPVGAGVPVFAGAPKNLDGRLDNTLLQAGLTSRATNAFSWLASVRYYESDEKTPQVRIIQTAATCPTCVDNTPLSFETLNAKLEGTYRMAYGLSLVGGLEYVDQDRSVPFGNANAAGLDAQRYVPFRAELEETILRLEVAAFALGNDQRSPRLPVQQARRLRLHRRRGRCAAGQPHQSDPHRRSRPRQDQADARLDAARSADADLQRRVRQGRLRLFGRAPVWPARRQGRGLCDRRVVRAQRRLASARLVLARRERSHSESANATPTAAPPRP